MGDKTESQERDLMSYYLGDFKVKGRTSSFLVMVMAVSLLGFAPSSAATSTTTACVTTKTGAIRILLKGTCKPKVEKKIS